MLAGGVHRYVAAKATPGRTSRRCTAAVWLAGQGIHIWADAVGYRSVTQLTRYLPGYFPIHAKRRMAKLGLVDPEVVERQRLLQKSGADGTGQLRYPLQPLRCEKNAVEPLNVLMVLIDGLRPDVIEPALLPNLSALRREGQDFAMHFSGGNSSRAGIFSAFYGLPSTYMEAFYAVQQPPVLMDELRARGYRFGLFSAPGFEPDGHQPHRVRRYRRAAAERRTRPGRA